MTNVFERISQEPNQHISEEMDNNRKQSRVYAYLLSVEEAKEWFANILKKEYSSINVFEQELRRGIDLCLVALNYAPEAIGKIWYGKNAYESYHSSFDDDEKGVDKIDYQSLHTTLRVKKAGVNEKLDHQRIEKEKLIVDSIFEDLQRMANNQVSPTAINDNNTIDNCDINKINNSSIIDLGINKEKKEGGSIKGDDLYNTFVDASFKSDVFILHPIEYRYIDNIYFFRKSLEFIGFPSIFIFDSVSLFEMKNMPSVIFCLHVLSHFLLINGFITKEQALKTVQNKIFPDRLFKEKEEELKRFDKQGLNFPLFSNIKEMLGKHIIRNIVDRIKYISYRNKKRRETIKDLQSKEIMINSYEKNISFDNDVLFDDQDSKERINIFDNPEYYSLQLQKINILNHFLNYFEKKSRGRIATAVRTYLYSLTFSSLFKEPSLFTLKFYFPIILTSFDEINKTKMIDLNTKRIKLLMDENMKMENLLHEIVTKINLLLNNKVNTTKMSLYIPNLSDFMCMNECYEKIFSIIKKEPYYMVCVFKDVERDFIINVASNFYMTSNNDYLLCSLVECCFIEIIRIKDFIKVFTNFSSLKSEYDLMNREISMYEFIQQKINKKIHDTRDNTLTNDYDQSDVVNNTEYGQRNATAYRHHDDHGNGIRVLRNNNDQMNGMHTSSNGYDNQNITRNRYDSSIITRTGHNDPTITRTGHNDQHTSRNGYDKLNITRTGHNDQHSSRNGYDNPTISRTVHNDQDITRNNDQGILRNNDQGILRNNHQDISRNNYQGISRTEFNNHIDDQIDDMHVPQNEFNDHIDDHLNDMHIPQNEFNDHLSDPYSRINERDTSQYLRRERQYGYNPSMNAYDYIQFNINKKVYNKFKSYNAINIQRHYDISFSHSHLLPFENSETGADIFRIFDNLVTMLGSIQRCKGKNFLNLIEEIDICDLEYNPSNIYDDIYNNKISVGNALKNQAVYKIYVARLKKISGLIDFVLETIRNKSSDISTSVKLFLKCLKYKEMKGFIKEYVAEKYNIKINIKNKKKGKGNKTQVNNSSQIVNDSVEADSHIHSQNDDTHSQVFDNSGPIHSQIDNSGHVLGQIDNSISQIDNSIGRADNNQISGISRADNNQVSGIGLIDSRRGGNTLDEKPICNDDIDFDYESFIFKEEDEYLLYLFYQEFIYPHIIAPDVYREVEVTKENRSKLLILNEIFQKMLKNEESVLLKPLERSFKKSKRTFLTILKEISKVNYHSTIEILDSQTMTLPINQLNQMISILKKLYKRHEYVDINSSKGGGNARGSSNGENVSFYHNYKGVPLSGIKELEINRGDYFYNQSMNNEILNDDNSYYKPPSVETENMIKDLLLDINLLNSTDKNLTLFLTNHKQMELTDYKHKDFLLNCIKKVVELVRVADGRNLFDLLVRQSSKEEEIKFNEIYLNVKNNQTADNSNDNGIDEHLDAENNNDNVYAENNNGNGDNVYADLNISDKSNVYADKYKSDKSNVYADKSEVYADKNIIDKSGVYADKSNVYADKNISDKSGMCLASGINEGGNKGEYKERIGHTCNSIELKRGDGQSSKSTMDYKEFNDLVSHQGTTASDYPKNTCVNSISYTNDGFHTHESGMSSPLNTNTGIVCMANNDSTYGGKYDTGVKKREDEEINNGTIYIRKENNELKEDDESSFYNETFVEEDYLKESFVDETSVKTFFEKKEKNERVGIHNKYDNDINNNRNTSSINRENAIMNNTQGNININRDNTQASNDSIRRNESINRNYSMEKTRNSSNNYNRYSGIDNASKESVHNIGDQSNYKTRDSINNYNHYTGNKHQESAHNIGDRSNYKTRDSNNNFNHYTGNKHQESVHYPSDQSQNNNGIDNLSTYNNEENLHIGNDVGIKSTVPYNEEYNIGNVSFRSNTTNGMNENRYSMDFNQALNNLSFNKNTRNHTRNDTRNHNIDPNIFTVKGTTSVYDFKSLSKFKENVFDEMMVLNKLGLVNKEDYFDKMLKYIVKYYIYYKFIGYDRIVYLQNLDKQILELQEKNLKLEENLKANETYFYSFASNMIKKRKNIKGKNCEYGSFKINSLKLKKENIILNLSKNCNSNSKSESKCESKCERVLKKNIIQNVDNLTDIRIQERNKLKAEIRNYKECCNDKQYRNDNEHFDQEHCKEEYFDEEYFDEECCKEEYFDDKEYCNDKEYRNDKQYRKHFSNIKNKDERIFTPFEEFGDKDLEKIYFCFLCFNPGDFTVEIVEGNKQLFNSFSFKLDELLKRRFMGDKNYTVENTCVFDLNNLINIVNQNFIQ